MTPRQTVAPAACAIHANCGEKVFPKQDWPTRLFTQSDEDAATHLRADKKRTARNCPYLAGASCQRSSKALSRNAVARANTAIGHRRAIGPARIFTGRRRADAVNANDFVIGRRALSCPKVACESPSAAREICDHQRSSLQLSAAAALCGD